MHVHTHYFIVIYIEFMLFLRDEHLEQTEGVDKVKGTVFRRLLFRAAGKSGSQGLAFELADAVEPIIQKQ